MKTRQSVRSWLDEWAIRLEDMQRTAHRAEFFGDDENYDEFYMLGHAMDECYRLLRLVGG